MRLRGRYPYRNPMEGDSARELIDQQRRRTLAAFADTYGRVPMPQESGVDNVRSKWLSAAYFRLRGDLWLPEIIEAPSLMNTMLLAGEAWGWSLREIGWARVLPDSGCRFHEAGAVHHQQVAMVNANAGHGIPLNADGKGGGRMLDKMLVEVEAILNRVKPRKNNRKSPPDSDWPYTKFDYCSPGEFNLLISRWTIRSISATTFRVESSCHAPHTRVVRSRSPKPRPHSPASAKLRPRPHGAGPWATRSAARSEDWRSHSRPDRTARFGSRAPLSGSAPRFASFCPVVHGLYRHP